MGCEVCGLDSQHQSRVLPRRKDDEVKELRNQLEELKRENEELKATIYETQDIDWDAWSENE